MKSDSDLQRDVIDELAWEPAVDHEHIGVAVHDGVVSLSGYVASYAEKLAAEAAARRVRGVKAIAEELSIRYPTDQKTADHEIAKRIVDLLAWDALVPAGKIDVKVERGWVTLSGTVDYHYQREAARRDAAKIKGVMGISSLILLSSSSLATATEVRERITAALRRQADSEAARVTVVTDGGKVRLGGRVAALYERGIAERAAWSAPGVTDVEDNIIVG